MSDSTQPSSNRPDPAQPKGTPSGSQPASQPVAGTDPIADRRIKLQRLRDELHIDPFGQRIAGLISLADARAKFDAAADADHKTNPTNPDTRPVVAVAGRVVLHRDIGKLVFMTLRDASGDLQVAVSQKSVDEKSFKLAKLTDLGDIVTTAGPLGTTKTGEVTLWSATATPDPRPQTPDPTQAFSIACKSLTPPPEKFHGLSDPELRYRHRYVDLWANPDVMRTMQLRARIVQEIRDYLRNKGFLEVETPMLQPIHGGAAARPFETHHNALDMKLYLRIAPELYLKRLLVGGFPKVFEINRNFRNEGISPRHNPEFTMLEAYEAFGSWETMADLVEDMVCTVAMNVFGTLILEHKTADPRSSATNASEAPQRSNAPHPSEAPHVNAGPDLANPRPTTRTINLTRPWRRVSMAALVEERTGWKFEKSVTVKLIPCEPVPPVIDQLIAKQIGPEPARDCEPAMRTRWNDSRSKIGHHFNHLSPAEQLVEVYEKLIEPTLIDPCFVTHVPSVVIPLAKENKDDPFFADVYELAINGQEISPGYTELNDPDTQERHFRHQVGDREEQQKNRRRFPRSPPRRHAPSRRDGTGHRPPRNDAHRRPEHSRCDPVPPDAPALLTLIHSVHHRGHRGHRGQTAVAES